MRIKRFDVSSDILKFLLDGEEKHFKITEGELPNDAVLIRVWVDPYMSAPNIISLFYISDSFPDLKDGSLLPTEKMMMERLSSDGLQ